MTIQKVEERNDAEAIEIMARLLAIEILPVEAKAEVINISKYLSEDRYAETKKPTQV